MNDSHWKGYAKDILSSWQKYNPIKEPKFWMAISYEAMSISEKLKEKPPVTYWAVGRQSGGVNKCFEFDDYDTAFEYYIEFAKAEKSEGNHDRDLTARLFKWVIEDDFEPPNLVKKS